MPYNRKVMKACGLNRLPDRRTFDRRFKAVSIDIRSRIDVMGMLFIKDGLVDLRDKALDKGQTWDGYALHKRWVGRPSHNIR